MATLVTKVVLVVHSWTLPSMSRAPQGLAPCGYEPTGQVPCRLQQSWSAGSAAPHGYGRSSVPRAASSHSSWSGSRRPRHAQNAAASAGVTQFIGWRSRSGRPQLHASDITGRGHAPALTHAPYAPTVTSVRSMSNGSTAISGSRKSCGWSGVSYGRYPGRNVPPGTATVVSSARLASASACGTAGHRSGWNAQAFAASASARAGSAVAPMAPSR